MDDSAHNSSSDNSNHLTSADAKKDATVSVRDTSLNGGVGVGVGGVGGGGGGGIIRQLSRSPHRSTRQMAPYQQDRNTKSFSAIAGVEEVDLVETGEVPPPPRLLSDVASLSKIEILEPGDSAGNSKSSSTAASSSLTASSQPSTRTGRSPTRKTSTNSSPTKKTRNAVQSYVKRSSATVGHGNSNNNTNNGYDVPQISRTSLALQISGEPDIVEPTTSYDAVDLLPKRSPAKAGHESNNKNGDYVPQISRTSLALRQISGEPDIVEPTTSYDAVDLLPKRSPAKAGHESNNKNGDYYVPQISRTSLALRQISGEPDIVEPTTSSDAVASSPSKATSLPSSTATRIAGRSPKRVKSAEVAATNKNEKPVAKEQSYAAKKRNPVRNSAPATAFSLGNQATHRASTFTALVRNISGEPDNEEPENNEDAATNIATPGGLSSTETIVQGKAKSSPSMGGTLRLPPAMNTDDAATSTPNMLLSAEAAVTSKANSSPSTRISRRRLLPQVENTNETPDTKPNSLFSLEGDVQGKTRLSSSAHVSRRRLQGVASQVREEVQSDPDPELGNIDEEQEVIEFDNSPDNDLATENLGLKNESNAIRQHKEDLFSDSPSSRRAPLPNTLSSSSNNALGSPPMEPGAYAMTDLDHVDESSSSLRDDPTPYQTNSMLEVQATLVRPSMDESKLQEEIRRELMITAVQADVVDTAKESKKLLHGIFLATCCVIALVVGLAVGLTKRLAQPPTSAPSAMPSSSPTEFTIALCSSYTFAEDVTLYDTSLSMILQRLSDEGEPLDLDILDICAPQALAAFVMAMTLGPNQERRTTILNSSFLVRYGLSVLFFATKGENWMRHDGWLERENFCDWEHLGCRFGRVLTELDLGELGLEGTIPSEIGFLSDLEKLEIAENFQLTGPIPSELVKLSQLEELKLHENCLTGSIPLVFFNLDRLKIVRMSENFLTGTITEGSVRIEQLLVSDNLLSGSLPKILGLLDHLAILDMSGNNFSGSLPTGFGTATRLQEIRLDKNEFTGQLPEELFSLEWIEELSLSNNNFSGSFPPNMHRLTRLSSLNLSRNAMTSTLPSELGLLVELKILNLSSNQFESTIPTTIGLLSHLDTLQLVGNKPTGTIPTTIGLLPEVTTLHLQGNQLQGFPSEIGVMSWLESLNLSNNWINAAIPTELLQLSRLNTLRVDNAGLFGTLMTELELLPLTVLTLASNNLEGTIPTHLPEFLAAINLKNNSLTGTVPNWIHTSYLEMIDVSQNEMNGTIPSEYGLISNLVVLNLGDNKGITGTIPTSLANLVALQYLYLKKTSLEGSVNAGICALTTTPGDNATLLVDVKGTPVSCTCCCDPCEPYAL